MKSSELLGRLGRGPRHERPGFDGIPFLPGMADETQRLRLVNATLDAPYLQYLEHFHSLRERPMCPKTFDMDAPCADCSQVDVLYEEATKAAVKKGDELRAKVKAWFLVWPIAVTASKPSKKDVEMGKYAIWERGGGAVRAILQNVAQVGGWVGDEPGKKALSEEKAQYLEKMDFGRPLCFGPNGRDLIIEVDSVAGEKDKKQWYKYRFTQEPGEQLALPEVPDLWEIFSRVKGIDLPEEYTRSTGSQPSVRGRPPRAGS